MQIIDTSDFTILSPGELTNFETAELDTDKRRDWKQSVLPAYVRTPVGHGMIHNCLIGRSLSNIEKGFTARGLLRGVDYELRTTRVCADGTSLPGELRACYVLRLSSRQPLYN